MTMHRAVVLVNAEEADILEKALKTEEPFAGRRNADLLGSWTGKFADGIECDVNVYNSETGPWSEVVLFDDGGYEICMSEVKGTLLGETEFEIDGETYIVSVEKEAA